MQPGRSGGPKPRPPPPSDCDAAWPAVDLQTLVSEGIVRRVAAFTESPEWQQRWRDWFAARGAAALLPAAAGPGVAGVENCPPELMELYKDFLAAFEEELQTFCGQNGWSCAQLLGAFEHLAEQPPAAGGEGGAEPAGRNLVRLALRQSDFEAFLGLARAATAA
eukprot:TRINITY_DN29364_c0_g1_i2.p1 TRINITY_DN29364_c0_g1~~TRINITY_DN29364_c0_g1_i2.p1  ORF type:complete len:164 (+),score=34.92 TRINITY_DN29364_c0_g1_i2:108-599(+)